MFTVKLKNVSGFTDFELKKVLRAIGIWQGAWNTDEFKNRIFNFGYINPVTKEKITGFYYSDGEKTFTNREVYNAIMRAHNNGVCAFNLVKKFQWNPWSSAVAQTDFNTQTVTIFSRYFKRASEYDLANTLSHEAGCHCAGFEHDFDYSKLRDDDSEPYAVGNITQEIAEKADGVIQ